MIATPGWPFSLVRTPAHSDRCACAARMQKGCATRGSERSLRRLRWSAASLLLTLMLLFATGVGAQTSPAQKPSTKTQPPQTTSSQTTTAPPPTPTSPAQAAVALEAREQRREGDRVIADGDVDVHYQSNRLRADHVEYDTKTYDTRARGNVQFDYENQHLEGSEATFNVKTGRGEYQHVRGTIKMVRIPNPHVLLSSNPLYFEAEEADRIDERTYEFHSVWLTICLPDQPIWKFFAAHATLKVDETVALVSANFRLLRIPVFYLPYASVPAGRRVRQSGFLIPQVVNSSTKGIVIGDSYYWAPKDWMDLEVGAQILSKRGWSQNVEFRALPWNQARLEYHYYGVEDRGLPGPNGSRVRQGGHQSEFVADAKLSGGWRAAADMKELSSLTFRLAFATTFSEATISEVPSAAFLTNNFSGFSLNVAALTYRDFLSAQPESSIVIRKAPEVRFSSVDQAPWKRWPIYFGFDTFGGAVHRSDPVLNTAAAVERSEAAPRVTVPFRWGPWFGAMATAAFRTTRYGALFENGTVVNSAATRNTGEFTVDMRPPSFERVWATGSGTKWKHVIEPDITYNYVTGVQDFSRFIRFDEDDTLTNTSELQYSLTQRLYRKRRDTSSGEFLSWRIAQKYYFDPTFGGALVTGQRNVFAALDSITPFAFASTPRRWSPIVSNFTINPASRYDLGFQADYDPVLKKLTALGTMFNVRPYRLSFINISHFDLSPDPVLQPHENQFRATVGWGQMNRRGWNGAAAVAYDARQRLVQYRVFQTSYNGSCCGISFEYRRFAVGPIRQDNQFRVSLLIANLGTFGTLGRQNSIF
jgi:LPS-assembly protein